MIPLRHVRGPAALATLLFAVVPAAPAAPAASPSPEARRILDRLDAARDAMPSWSARVEGTIRPEGGGREERLGGQMTFARPGRFRWEFEGAEPRVYVLADGMLSGWIPSKNQVERMDVSRIEGRMRRLLAVGQGGRALARDFRVTLAPSGGAATDELVLVPKSRRARQKIREVRLWVERGSGLPAAVQYDVVGRGLVRLALSAVTPRPAPPPGTFALAVPKGARVVSGLSTLVFAPAGNEADDTSEGGDAGEP